MGDSLKERQENEVEVLRAIFMDDFRDLNEGNKDISPHISLRLQPCESMGENKSYVSLDLDVKYREEYPNRCPVLKLENAKGLSNDKVLELEKEIQCMAASLVGEVMILELAQHVQSFLHKNNVPPPLSFYEEMMAKKKRDNEEQKASEMEKKEKERQAKVIQVEEEEQQIREEMMRRDEALKNLKRQSLKDKENLRVELLSQTVSESVLEKSEDKPARERIKRKSSSEDVVPYDGLRVVTFENKKQHIVHCGKCLGSGQYGSTVFCGLDIVTGGMVAMSEWSFKSQTVQKRPSYDRAKIEDEKLLKQVASIEQEINSLITRVSHHNLVHYLGTTQVRKENTLTLQILTEFVAGASLMKELLSGGLGVEIVRDYAQQLLEVLAYLHGKSIVHKDIRLSSVFLDQNKTIRLADYSVGRRLRDLYQVYGEKKLSKKVNANEAKSSQRSTKRRDIVNLGLLMLSLLEGDVVNSAPPSIPQSFPCELQDFFARCLYPDSGEQLSAAQLLNHSFIAPSTFVSSLANNVIPNGMESDKNQSCQVNDTGNYADNSVREIPFLRASVVGNSRVRNEFEVLQWLGKGGFGSVVKVKNKLDGCFYAIKRVPLNPKSVQFNRKITREVKLLSRLNHENIVRYYNSWIEVEEAQDGDSSSSETKSSVPEARQKPSTIEDSLMKMNDVEAPSIRASIEDDGSWLSGNIEQPEESSSSSSSDEEEILLRESSEDIMFTWNTMEESLIQFRSCSLADVEEESDFESEEETSPTESSQDSKPQLQCLYIQMEFCEKSTLRSVIDEGLYKNQQRIWRLLREIVEGLVHVHSQGMIHRDLKPVNIFLDSNDRVKIGDFGLATIHPFTVPVAGSTSGTQGVTNKVETDNAPSHESLTGKVGTALYVSPELGNAFRMTRYTAKVDLYSLGIIFFEMCYKPLETTMERVKILGDLRTEKILLPKEFNEEERLKKQAVIIRWLLHHNPDERPTSQELLKSQHIPPNIEDNELEEILNHTLATTNSTRYRTLISYVMNQEIAQNKLDLTYDYEIIKAQFSGKHAVVKQLVNHKLEGIFLQHGFHMLNTPLLIPKNKVYKHSETSVVVMDHSGAILTLPYDLRTSFARYLARNNFPPVKRYSISNVYRDARILGVHPREHSECVIDIATSSPCDLVPDAEILYTVGKIISDFPSLVSRNYYVRINHAVLTRSILAMNGISEDKILEIISLLQESKGEVDRLQQLKRFLLSSSFSEEDVLNICRWLLMETPLDIARSSLGHMARGPRTASHKISNALQELEKIVKHAKRLGLTLQVNLYPSLVYNIQYMSGALFQFVAEKKGKAKAFDILAAGGRNDKLISIFSGVRELPAGYGAVGVSINVERIIQSAMQELDDVILNTCDVMVCAVGENPMLKERSDLVVALRNQLGISASISYEMLTDEMLDYTQAYCKECGIQYMLIVEEKAPTIIRIVEKDKEIKGIEDPVEYLKLKYQEPTENSDRDPPVHKAATTSNESNTQAQPKFNIDFVTQEKLEKNTKRRYESHMKSKVTNMLQSFGGNKNSYCIIGVDLPVSVLKSIAVSLDLSDSNSKNKFNASVKMICEQLKQIKHRRHVPYVCDKIFEEKENMKVPIIFLYSCHEEQCVMMQV
ncbi:eIF-2-alpha kinase GCN2-like [Dendronephthya gigantea]|uniref:eIF-2-alpha kinase GCN2-like n=1 Tax=Dendronephthya gigantea TaxID=151771 RepID=UPI00106C1D86|nr:eIF-2-alpha kinase GCN2-like [Dendronephthya gigantea]